jgi:OOP family OmpA-OmpF porin
LEKKMNPQLAYPTALLSLLALFASPVLFAQEFIAHTGHYMGIGAGQSQAHIDNARIQQNLMGQGLSTTTLTEDDLDTGYKAYLGFPIHPNWAVEAGYFDLGRFGFNATTSPNGSLTGSARIRGLNLDLVGTLPVTERWSLMGRVGAAYAQTQTRFSSSGAVAVSDPTSNRRETNYKYGLGTQYAFTPSLSLRLEAERFRVNDAVGRRGDVDLVTLGLVYRFGGPATQVKTAASTPYVPIAEPVSMPVPIEAPAPMSAPEPATVPRPVTPTPTPVAPAPWVKIKLESDSLFGFDQDQLQADGKNALDKLIQELRPVNIDAVQITGHTDRLGSPTYNAKLSQRRAEAVKIYLVQMGRIPTDKITATGVGSQQPVTMTSDCKGTHASQALITCLRTDRRVEVEVMGSQPQP